MAILGRAIVLPLAAVSALLLAAPPQAEAQNLFQILFGGWGRQTAQPEAKRAIPTRPNRKVKRNRPPIPKIASPSYHDYKADPLVGVDFQALQAALETMPQLSGLEPKLAGAAFYESVSGLQGLDLRVEKDIAEALVEYYSGNPEFIWVSGLDANERAMEAVRTLDEADAYGLNPSEYSVPVLRRNLSLENIGPRLDALLRFEMALSARVLRYVRDAEGGRVDPNRLSGYYDFPARPLDHVAVLKSLSHTSHVRTYLESRHPQNAEYQALRVELEMLRADETEEDVEIDSRLLLKPGGTSAELPKLLAAVSRDLGDGNQFEEVLSRNSTSQVYDDELVPVIRAAQEKLGLKPDGVIGPRTVTALAGISKAMRLNKVLVALEQMRWLPSDLGSPRVFINQPAFTASYIEGSHTRLTTQTVIGMPTNQTSFFYDEIEQVDYNPYWGVPQSIMVNEMLPRLRRDPGYLDRSGYEVTDGKGRRIPSSAINWGAYGARIPYNVRQVPSEANALGELKILFPNKHAIYMHDTPAKELFQQDVRAFSHGCIRLQDPRGMAAAVLGTSVEYIAERLKHGHSSEMVKRRIPVYVAYFTAWPDDTGKVQYFHDIYDRDSHLQTAIEKTSAARLTDG